jgi:hypothetical protein
MKTVTGPVFWKMLDSDGNVLYEGMVTSWRATTSDPYSRPSFILEGFMSPFVPVIATNPVPAVPVCECGVGKVGGTHSSWCPIK